MLGLADNVREWVLTPAGGRQVIGLAGGSWFSNGENVGLTVSGGGTVDDGPQDAAGSGPGDHRVGFRCARDP